MTLGINNGIIIMEADNQYDFEFNMQPYQEQYKEQREIVDWRMEQRGYHLNKALKIVKKYYYRTFMGRFKSAVYQMLIQNITRSTQNINNNNEIDWPYRSLLIKPNKNQHQLLQIEFINMCAEKIQAVFKGYLTRKRYRVAFGRAKKFMGLMNAVVKGWKVRRIMRCIKVKQEIKSIQIKKGEVDKQENNNNTNKFNFRRFQYLKNSLKTEISHFHNHFYELYFTGAWIYEPKIEIPRIKVKKWSDKKQIVPMKQNNFNQIQLQTVQFIPEAEQQQVPQKKKRVREMRNNVRKAKNQEGVLNQKTGQDQLKNQSTISQITTNTNTFSEDKPIQAKGSYSTSVSEDRPIQAKGAYNFNDEAASMPPPAKQTPIEQNTTQDEQKRIQLQKIQKKKLQKRQKYDPRKAIEEEKKRKKQQQGKEKQEQMKSTTDIPQKPKPQEHKSKQQNTKSQKNIKIQKDQNNRSTVNFPKNKAKVQAKIDCWGNRKTVTKKNIQQNFKINKIITNNSQISQPIVQKNLGLIPSQKLAAKIHQRRGKQKEKLEYSQQREKARIQIEKNCEESQRIKQYLQLSKQHQARQSQAAKYLKAQSLRQRQKVMQQQSHQEQQKDKRKDAVYRSVSQLAQTYRTQYITRYQNLHPKLNLLAAARNTQQSSRIPVLSLESQFVERMMEQNKLNQRFWYTVSKMQRAFKEFIKS